MSNTAGAKAWRFLKRNPHCIGARRKVPGATPDETAPCWPCVRRRGHAPVAPVRGVRSKAGRVRGLSLVLVSDGAHREIWHGLMASEHPRGAGPLVGCQLRYLVGSEHGWLGGVGIATTRTCRPT